MAILFLPTDLWNLAWVQVHVDKAIPVRMGMYREQGIVASIEICDGFGCETGSFDQLPIQIISPSMILAGKYLGVAMILSNDWECSVST